MRFLVLSPDAERRDGLKALLRQIDRHGGYNDAKDWRQAMRVVRQHSFDMIVVDAPHGPRLGDLRALCEASAPTPVAVLVDDTSATAAQEQFATGAQGVVPRSMGSHLVIRAFEMVLLGGYYIPPVRSISSRHAWPAIVQSVSPGRSPCAASRAPASSHPGKRRSCVSCTWATRTK